MTKKPPVESQLHELKNAQNQQIGPFLKLVLEMGPLAVFFFANYKGTWLIENVTLFHRFDKPIFLATLLFIIAILISFIFSWHITKKLPLIPLITAVFVLFFGILTLWFHDEVFIKLKPTIINLFFSLILFIGLYFKKPFLGYVFDSAFQLDDEGWTKLSRRWAYFFLFLALLNEIIWRNFSTSFWASFKVFGTTPLSFIFLLFQMPLILKHTIDEKKETTLPPSSNDKSAL